MANLPHRGRAPAPATTPPLRTSVRPGARPGVTLTFVILVCCATVICALGYKTAPARAAGAARAAQAPQVQTTFDWRSRHPSAERWASVSEDARREGNVRVIVGLRLRWTADGALAAPARSAQRQQLVDARATLLATLRGQAYRRIRAYRSLPLVALELSPSAVDALRRGGRAATVSIDALNGVALDTSAPLVEADDTARLGYGGGGQTIAVLDTGVDASHPFLAGRVVGGCDATDAPWMCLDLSAGLQESGPCTYSGRCAHGTHVAGIAAGRNGTFGGATFSGVAPDANIVSIQVFHRDDSDEDCQKYYEDFPPCPLASDADVLWALDRIIVNYANYNFAAVNLSLGGGDYPIPCDLSAYTSAVAELASFGIATVASSGNDGTKNGIGNPACAPGVVSVGNTDDSDKVAEDSQSALGLSLLAPGTGILSSVPGGGFATKSGTSMAAPHVAGAFAVLKQRFPAADVPTLLGALQATGKPVTDAKNNLTTPRLRLLTALVSLGDLGFRRQYSNLLPGGRIVSEGSGVRPSGSTITINTIPSGAVVKRAYLFFMTVRGSDSDMRVYVNGTPLVAELIGASRDPCTTANGSAVRVYRTAVTGVVTGNGSYTISGIGGSGTGEGVSLVAATAQPGALNRGIEIRAGAITARAGESMTHTFEPITPTLSDVDLNVGIGAGDYGSEGQMTLGNQPMFIANAFSALDGPWWDDQHSHIRGTSSLLGPVNNIESGTDCLSWAYAALSYAA